MVKQIERWDGTPCPVCGRGTLHDDISATAIDFRGETFHAQERGAYCDVCGHGMSYHDAAGEAQWKQFRSDVLQAQQRELVELRRQLGLTQQQASRLTGGGHNAFSRYERGEAVPVIAVMQLLRLLVRHPDLLAEVDPALAAARDADRIVATTRASGSALDAASHDRGEPDPTHEVGNPGQREGKKAIIRRRSRRA